MNVYPVIDTEEPQKETLAMLAHDLRTPMCSVVGAAQLAMRAQAQGKPVDEQLRQIVGAVQAMDRMLSRMCSGSCGGCQSKCSHTPMEELTALMKYMVGHNAAHAKELADLAIQLEKAGNHAAYEQVMAAVSDFEKGNMRLSLVLASMQ